MAWSQINKAPLNKSIRKDPPEGLWIKCKNCNEIIYRKDFEANQRVCTKCHHHYSLPALARIAFFCDTDTFRECDRDLRSTDPLNFVDKKPYRDRLDEYYEKTGYYDAIICGEAKLCGRPIQIAVYDFEFMGGSMGSVVGEKIARTFMRARDKREPAIVFSTSGGARMQEGILSLMQMAKTCAALSMMRDVGIPLISIMTNPTTGGVAASYAMLGDVNIGEPGALIGFAGPRVIAQTLKQNLPEGFQTSEYLLEHGMLDLICHRDALRDRVAQIIEILLPRIDMSHDS